MNPEDVNKGRIRIVVRHPEEAPALFEASSPDMPGIVYRKSSSTDAVRSLRVHILREQMTQLETGSAPEWIAASMPVFWDMPTKFEKGAE